MAWLTFRAPSLVRGGERGLAPPRCSSAPLEGRRWLVFWGPKDENVRISCARDDHDSARLRPGRSDESVLNTASTKSTAPKADAAAAGSRMGNRAILPREVGLANSGEPMNSGK